jgi:predicted nucleic acid-binding protein
LSDLYLLDTNVLVRSADPQSAQHAAATAAISSLTASGALLHVAPQVLIEFWAVATRPISANGLGKTTAEAVALVGSWKRGFAVLPDAPAIFDEWQRLVSSYGVSGKPTHDARLVAVMKAHGLTHFLTFNGGDFARYESGEGITVIEPANVPPVAPATGSATT